MKVINDQQVIYSFNAQNRAVGEIQPGDEVKFLAKDCFSNQLQHEEDRYQSISWERMNPASGPIDIMGAEPGDTLKVMIKEIEVAEQGVMVLVPGMGAYGQLVEESVTKIIPIRDGKAIFHDQIKIPIEPMIGVIGTAPKFENFSCGTPGRHGGNMDTKLIRAGSVIYLPVFVPGGKLALGDLHAAQGDGEAAFCGLEIAGEVTLQVELIKNLQADWPILETQTHWYLIASGGSLEEATELALEGFLDFLSKRLTLSRSELIFLMSFADLEYSQVVDPLKTVRMGIKKELLVDLDFSF